MKKVIVILGLLIFMIGCPKPPPQPPEPNPTPRTPPVFSNKILGLTLDNTAKLSDIVSSLKAMPSKPWVRIVFDYPYPASDYKTAVTAISKVAVVVGQPSDSTYSAKMSVSQFEKRFKDYVDTLPEVDIWETCNECNGDWAGNNTPAQTDKALALVKASGKKSMFVPYWNTPTCMDKHGEYKAWTQKNISSYVKNNTDYVMISIYGMDCDGPEPTYAQMDSEIAYFKAIFPSAVVGIGEYGAKKSEDKEKIMQYYLKYPQLGFGGYWYGFQDLVPKTKTLWKTFITR